MLNLKLLIIRYLKYLEIIKIIVNIIYILRIYTYGIFIPLEINYVLHIVKKDMYLKPM